MRQITPMDLRRSLGSILDEASAGERFLIERDHHPLAVLVSVEDAARLEEDPEAARSRRMAAVQAIEEWRKRVVAERPGDVQVRSAAAWVRADRDERDRRDRQRASKVAKPRRKRRA